MLPAQRSAVTAALNLIAAHEMPDGTATYTAELEQSLVDAIRGGWVGELVDVLTLCASTALWVAVEHGAALDKLELIHRLERELERIG